MLLLAACNSDGEKDAQANFNIESYMS